MNALTLVNFQKRERALSPLAAAIVAVPGAAETAEQQSPHIFCIQPENIDAIWPHVRHLIAKAHAKVLEAMSDADMLADLRAKKLLLWVVWDGAAVLGVFTVVLYKASDGRVCKIMHCGGGSLERWLHLLAEVEQWALLQDCVRMRIEGRRGWQRVLPDYRQTGVILEKRL